MSEKKATIQSNKGKEIDNKIPDKQEKTDKKDQNNSTSVKNDNQIEQTSKIEADKNENSQTNVNANNQDEKKPDPQNQQSENIHVQNANNQNDKNDKRNKIANEDNANSDRNKLNDKDLQKANTEEKNNKKNNDPNNDDSFFKKHKLKFLIGFIISIFIIIALVVILIVVLIKTKKNEETEKNGKTEFLKNQETLNKEKLCNENCFQCDHSSERCISCNSDFELYNGKCIQYAFSATYDFITVNYSPIKLFNQDKVNNLFAMKINTNDIITPNHELYSYDYYGNNKIYYYLDDNSNNISLSYLFENIPELIEISFNDENINNFNITNMKGMFSGCNSLKNVNFNSFKGQNLVEFHFYFLVVQH
jgi:hypothetical protein